MISFIQDSVDFGEIIEPEKVEFSFGAPGWYVLLACFCLLIGLFFVFRFQQKRKNRYRVNALAYISKLESDFGLNKELIFKTNALLKSLLLNFVTREKLAKLSTKQWLDFLNEKCNQPIFTNEDALFLEACLYKNTVAADQQIKALVEKQKQWISKHKRKADGK